VTESEELFDMKTKIIAEMYICLSVEVLGEREESNMRDSQLINSISSINK
jgi:hypothetical protein